MNPFQWLFAGFIAWGVLYWLVMAACVVRMLRQIRILENLWPAEPNEWPKLSVIVAACNEAETLEAASTSILKTDYPNLEIVLVDDRSTDGTAEIVDRLAAGDSRVRPLHVRELPEGWLGKVHALHQAVAQATGDWFLFTDADVHFAAQALRRAVAYSEERGLDHLAALPELTSGNFWMDTVMVGATRLAAFVAQQRALENPKSRIAIGVGAFNLVRRSTFERTEGFPWLRMEVVDDYGLGHLLKRAGARCFLVNAQRQVIVNWYPSIRAFARGGEKTGFNRRLNLVILAISLLEMSPFLGLIPVGVPFLQLVSLATVALAWALSVAVSRWMNLPILPGFFIPVAHVLGIGVVLRSLFLSWLRGGVYWRGTLYSNEALRTGKRIPFP